jgi:SpoVK/Ycf46/Vps4 family AAA+-type ATPase
MKKTTVDLGVKTFKKVSDIVVPDEFFHPLKTGSPELDSAFSELGGLIPSQVILFTGNPGSGKTTLAAVAASRLSKQGSRPPAFLSYEMSDFQLKAQARKIPGFENLLVTTHEFHKELNGLDNLFRSLEIIKPSVVIVDSLQKMASRMPEGPTRGQVVLVERFTKWAKKTFTPVILIGHNGKGGDYAGPSFLKHEVDSHLQVWFDKETHERLFAMSKNRFGGNLEQYGFRITSENVFVGNEWWMAKDLQNEDAADMIMTFKKSSTKNLDWVSFKDAATSLINHLNKKYAERFAEGTFIKSPEKVKLSWDGKRFCCYFHTGQIKLGRQWFNRITEDNWREIGYRSEKPYIQKFVNSKEDAMLWTVLHEWVHLFKGFQRHTSVMWKEIAKIAQEESWIWSKQQTA